jgi:predicted acetyltransferase
VSAPPPPFPFVRRERWSDGVVDLVVEERRPADPSRGHVPCYVFRIERTGAPGKVGEVHLRVGHVPSLQVSGHLGYEVEEAFRGRGYAARGCRLTADVARTHGVRELVVTCDPENFPSRRTCEKLGAVLRGIYEVPPDHDLYRRGARRYCQYVWTVPPGPGGI